VLGREKIKTGENAKKSGKKKQDGPETRIGVAAEEKNLPEQTEGGFWLGRRLNGKSNFIGKRKESKMVRSCFSH